MATDKTPAELLVQGKVPPSREAVCCQVGDEDRGYLLELLLTKLRYMQVDPSLSQIGSSTRKLQIIGMSATMPNAAEVARWLDAELYETDYRPVPLTMLLKVAHPYT